MPKAGVYAEGAARTVAANIISRMRNEAETARNPGGSSCYIEFGANRIGRVDVDFLLVQSPSAPSMARQKPCASIRNISVPAAAPGGSERKVRDTIP